MEEEKDLNLTELTQYQLRFIDEYMKCGNKREAMLKCGYKGKGKRSTVTSSAAKLYNLPKVQAEIERRRRELAEENLIDAKAIVKRLTKMFNGKLSSEFVTKQGQVRPHREDKYALPACSAVHLPQSQTNRVL
ncbi:terminase small subunit [Candidatus Woesearchaeota archaeon]|nr:terminase small subunit [Candidatus Woesearchaeota archaeon]